MMTMIRMMTWMRLMTVITDPLDLTHDCYEEMRTMTTVMRLGHDLELCICFGLLILPSVRVSKQGQGHFSFFIFLTLSATLLVPLSVMVILLSCMSSICVSVFLFGAV